MTIKRILAALILSLALMTSAGASLASAHGASTGGPPQPGPLAGDCSAIRTVADSGWFHWAGRPYDTKEIIERQYTPGGANCNSWRVRTLISTWGVVTGLTIRDNFQMGGGTYWQTTWTNQTLQNGFIYYYGSSWHDLTTVATGCVWSSEGYLSTTGYFYSPYTCV